MNQRVLKRLFDALDCAAAVGEIVAGKSLQDYLNDRSTRSAVERELEKVGEALLVARRIEPQLIDLLPDLHRVIGLRHRIVHGYDDLNDEQVWYIALHEAPELVLALQKILHNFGDIPV